MFYRSMTNNKVILACITTNLKSIIKVDSVGHVIPGIRLKLQPVFGGENTEVMFIMTV